MPNTVFQPRLLQIVPHYTPNTDINQNVANVLWFQSAQPGNPGQADLIAIQNSFEAVWSQLVVNLMAASKSFIGSVITDWSTATGLTHDSRPSIYSAPGVEGAANPAQVAALVSNKDGLHYRGGHSRVYIPWIGDSALDATNKNNLSQLALDGANTRLLQVLSAMAGSGTLGGQAWVVYHHRTDPTKANLRPVLTSTMNRTTATQRRRLRKIPRHKKKT